MQLRTVFQDQPAYCAKHEKPKTTGAPCMQCDIFAAWINPLATSDEYTYTQLEILTGVPMIRIRAAASLAMYREQYGDYDVMQEA